MFFGRVKQGQRAGEIEVGIGRQQERRRAVGDGGLDEDRGGPGPAHERGVLRVRQEGQLAGAGFFQARRSADFQVGGALRGALEGAAEGGSDLA